MSRHETPPSKILAAVLGVVAVLGIAAIVLLLVMPGSGPRPTASLLADASLGPIDLTSPAISTPIGGPSSQPPGTATAAATDNPTPTAMATDAASATPSATGGPTPTAAPTPTSTPPPTAPTAAPTSTPTAAPTAPPTAAPTTAPTPTPHGPDPQLLAAGDVRSNTTGIMATTRLIESLPGRLILNVGDDTADGTAAEYASYFDPAWGRFKNRIYPVPGNHEYHTAGAAPYFAYYGSHAGARGRGWYSFDLSNSWHVVALNGNIGHTAGSAQEVWLRGDLAAHAGMHVIAFWHQPRFSSGTEHGSDASYTAFWNDLYAARADIVLNGHDHDYERFAPQNPAGAADGNGIREFVVGMGGTTERSFSGGFVANSQAHNDNCWGVLKLTLRAHSYDWQFLPVAGGSYRDSGTQATHS